jgi:hypothetical protein
VQQACCSFLLLQKLPPPPPLLRLPPRATASLSLLGNGCASSLRNCRGEGPPRLQGRADLVQHRECAPLTNSSVDQLFLVLVLALDFLAVAASTFSTSRVFFIFFRVSNSLLLRSKNHRKLAENTLAISFHLCIAPKTSEPQRQRENSSKNSELSIPVSPALSFDSSPTPSEFFVSAVTFFSQKKKKTSKLHSRQVSTLLSTTNKFKEHTNS